MFEKYPDIVTIEQVTEMLNIGKSKTYELLRTNTIQHVRVGNKYIIPKKSIIALFSGLCYNEVQIVSSGLQAVIEGGVTQ